MAAAASLSVVQGGILEILVRSNTGEYVKNMSQADNATKKFTESVRFLGRVASEGVNLVERFGKRSAVAGAGLTASFVAATRTASQFSSEIRNVNTILKLHGSQYDKLSQSVLNLSKRFPQSTSTLTSGLYDIASSGFQAQDSLEILTQASRAATAGMTSTGVAASSITAILNAYGLGASEAADVSDILFKAVEKGVFTFEDLATTTGEWVSVAAAVGVSADQAAAALATMTLSGIQAAEASTSLSRVLEEFISPGEGMTKTLHDLGYESGTAFLQANGLRDAMIKLGDATGNSAEGFTALFPNVRAARGALALAANEGKNYTAVATDIIDKNKRAGSTQAAYAENSKELSLQITLLKNELHALVVEVGQNFIPAAKFAVQYGLRPMLAVMQAIPKPVFDWTIKLIAAGSVLVTVGGALAGWGLKMIIWHKAMELANLALLRFAPSAAMAGTRLNTLSMSLQNAGKYSGPLRGSIAAIGTALEQTRLRGIVPFIGTLAAMGAGILAGIVIAKLLTDQFKQAQKEGHELGRTFAEKFDTTTLDEATTKVKALRAEIVRLQPAANTGFKIGGLTDFSIDLTRSTKAKAEQNELRNQIKIQENEVIRARERIAGVLLQKYGRKTGLIGPIIGPEGPIDEKSRKGLDDNIKLLTKYQSVLGISADKTIDFYAKFAESKGIDLTIDIDPNDPSKMEEYAKRVDEIRKKLADLAKINTAGSANMQNVASSMIDLGDAFATAKTKVEALEKAMDAFVAAALGLEDATDTVEGDLTKIYKDVQDIKKAGTLNQAVDLQSFHDDAIALRGDFRGLVGDISAQSIEWAKSQKDLKGEDFNKYLRDRADYIRAAGKEMGLDSVFVEHYAKMIEDIGKNRDLEINFNSNVAQAGTELEEYLRKLGMAPENITTAVTLYRDKGEAALRAWLTSVYQASGEEVTTVINLMNDDAKAKLIAWQGLVKLSTGDVETLVKLQFSGDNQALQDFLSKKGIQGDQYKAFVDIVGKDDATLALGIINSLLKDLNQAKIEPKVTINTSEAMSRIIALQTALDHLQQTQIALGGNQAVNAGNQAPPISVNPRTGLPSFMDPTTDPNRKAKGEVHQAQIGWDTRMWAEPETGGEAYIPLAMSKRGRSTSLLQQVGSMFGYSMKKFQGGGFNFPGRIRPEEPKAASGGGGADAGPVTTALEYIRNQYTAGVIGMDQLRAALMNELGGLEQFSNEWTRIWSEISDLDKKAVDDLEQHNRDLEEAVKKEDDVWKFRVEENTATGAEYLVWLRQQIAKEKQYSERWMELKREINAVEKDITNETKRARDARFEAGDTSLGDYIQMLRNDLGSLDKYSDEWLAAKNKLDQLTGREAFKSFAGFGQFSNADFVSENQLLKYFERQASKAQRWSALVTDLSGKVHPWVLDELIKGGPASLPMAEALQRMVNNGSLGTLNGYVGAIQGAGDSFMRATSQPAMVSPQGNSMAGSTYQINFENVQVASNVDLNRLLQEYPMIVNAKWGIG